MLAKLGRNESIAYHYLMSLPKLEMHAPKHICITIFQRKQIKSLIFHFLLSATTKLIN